MKIFKTIIVVVALVSVAIYALAQVMQRTPNQTASTPKEILSSFFGPSGIKDKQSVYVGEMLITYMSQPTLGESLPAGASLVYRKLKGDSSTEIWTITIVAQGRTANWYAYLKMDSGAWKLDAVRTLALSGVFYQTLESLSSQQRSASDELTYQNLLLTEKSDAELKQYFLDNKQKFVDLAASVQAGNQNKIKPLIETLHLNTTSLFSKNKAITDISIGGILDNSVGFLNVPKGVQPPKMSPEEFIYVEKIADGWYLYKTT